MNPILTVSISFVLLGGSVPVGIRLASGATVEVIGVCRLQGESPECWDAKGRTSSVLSRKVAAAIHGPQIGGDFKASPGLKYRLVVVREIYPGREGQSARYASLKGHVPKGGFAYVNLPQNAPDRRGPLVTVHAISMLPKDRETSMMVEVWSGLGSALLPGRVGASVKLGGQRFTVSRIARANARQAQWFGPPIDRVWVESVAISGKALPKSGVTPGFGHQMYVGRDGRIASARDRNAWRRAHPWGKAPFEAVDLTYRSPRPHVLEIILNVDPRIIPPVELGGLQTRLVEVKGIRLDPR